MDWGFGWLSYVMIFLGILAILLGHLFLLP